MSNAIESTVVSFKSFQQRQTSLVRDSSCLDDPVAWEMNVPTQSNCRSPSADVLLRQCDHCIESQQRECAKTRRGGACDFCACKHKKCSLTELVRAYWKAIGDPRGRSRSRSRGPGTRSRRASLRAQ